MYHNGVIIRKLILISFILVSVTQIVFGDVYSNIVDYYAVLGANPKMTQEELKSAYKKMAFKYHPDRYAHKGEAEMKEAEKKFVEIGQAWDILGDSARRQQYDKELVEKNRSTASQNNFRSRTQKNYDSADEGSNTKSRSSGESNYSKTDEGRAGGFRNGSSREPQNIDEFLKMQNEYDHWIDRYALKRSYISKVKNVDDFLRVLDPRDRYWGTSKDITNLIKANLKQFFNLKPSVEQILKIEKFFVDASLSMALRKKILNDNFTVNDFLMLTSHLPEGVAYKGIFRIQLIKDYYQRFLKAQPTAEQILELEKGIVSSKLSLILRKEGLKRAKTADEILRLTRPLSNSAASYELAKLQAESLDDFFRAKPTMQQALAFSDQTNNIYTSMEIKRRAIRMANQPEDYERLYRYPRNASAEYKREMQKLIGETFNDYLKTNPGAEGLKGVLENNVKEPQLRTNLMTQLKRASARSGCLSDTLNKLLNRH